MRQVLVAVAVMAIGMMLAHAMDADRSVFRAHDWMVLPCFIIAIASGLLTAILTYRLTYATLVKMFGAKGGLIAFCILLLLLSAVCDPLFNRSCCAAFPPLSFLLTNTVLMVIRVVRKGW